MSPSMQPRRSDPGDGDWKFTFKSYKNDAGQPISYDIDHEDAPEGYTAAITGNAAEGFTITLTHKKVYTPTDPTDPTDSTDPTTSTTPTTPVAPTPITPATGDHPHLVLWIGLMLVSAIGFAALVLLQRKKYTV